MSSKYPFNKVPLENKLDAKYPSKAHNEKFLNTVDKEGFGNGVMGHASKPVEVDPMPNYDMNRVDLRKHEYGNTPGEAFDYEY